MIGDLLLALRVGVAAGRDARQQARRGEGVIEPETAGRERRPAAGNTRCTPWRRRESGATHRPSPGPAGGAKWLGAQKVVPASSASGMPVLKSPMRSSGSAMRASAAASRAFQNRVLAAPSGSLAPGIGGENVDDGEAESPARADPHPASEPRSPAARARGGRSAAESARARRCRYRFPRDYWRRCAASRWRRRPV